MQAGVLTAELLCRGERASFFAGEFVAPRQEE
jgi:hypothetical protein